MLQRPSKTGREWGDGHTTRSRHTIAEVMYSPGLSGIVCSDGSVLSAPTPEALELLWQEHGGAIMKPEAEDRATSEPTVLIDEARSISAMEAILAITRACTCGTADIIDCPNYMPGDELPEEDE